MFNLTNILIYSYLLPLAFFLFLKKETRTKKEVLVIVIYSLTFFLLLKVQSVLLNHDKVLTDKEKFWDKIKDLFYAFFTFTELIFFTAVYWINIKTKKFKILSIAVTLLFVISQVVYYFSVKTVRIDSIPVGLETLIVYIYIFFFFYDRFRNIDDQYIYNNYCFWVSIGIMIYMGGSFFFFILGNHLSPEQNEKYWDYSFYVDIAKNILFSISLFVYAKHTDNIISKPKNIPFLDFN